MQAPLHEAAWYGSLEAGAVLLEHGRAQVGRGDADQPCEARIEGGEALELERKGAWLLRELVVQPLRRRRALVDQPHRSLRDRVGQLVEHVRSGEERADLLLVLGARLAQMLLEVLKLT